MIELPDDELDKLFRKSSEELDPQYDPEDWNSLKKRLDQHDGRGGVWFKKWWPLGLLLLLISIGVATYLWKGEKNAESKIATNAQKNAQPEILKLNKKAEAVTSDKTEQKQNLAGKPTGNDQTHTKEEIARSSYKLSEQTVINRKKENNTDFAINKKATGKPFPKSDFQAAEINSRPILPRSRSKAGGVYLEPNRSKTTEGGDGALILSEKESISDRNATGGLTNNEVDAVNADTEPERMAVTATMLASRPLSWNCQGVKSEIESAKSEIQPESTKVKEEVPQAKWAVRFGYSPDLSTVGLKNFTKPGTAVALLAELSVLPRLFVQTGAVWSRKDYFAEAGSYILPAKWGYNPKPESVDGICKVLEIPLNLRYDIVSGQRSRFFIGSGVSSYYMLNEKYKYNYEYPDDPNIKHPGWEGTSGWFLLSHLNASAGYEYRLSNKLSLLGEPYARIPLKRVGYGKVNLVTMGFWLSLRYTPAFR